jgi:hypothetical protein
MLTLVKSGEVAHTDGADALGVGIEGRGKSSDSTSRDQVDRGFGRGQLTDNR